MMEDKRMKALMEATGGIREDFIEEAAQPKKRRSTVLRIAAAAAVLALVLGCLFFPPRESAEPLFFVSVMADDELNAIIDMTVALVEELPEEIDPAWSGREVFCVEVRMQNAPPEYLENSWVTVDYLGRNVTQSAAWEQLDVRFPEDTSDGVLCRIYGWAKDMKEEKLSFIVSVSNATEGVETVLCQQPFEAFYTVYGDSRLFVNYDLTVRGEYTVTMEIMSTEELVDIILGDENAPFAAFFSSEESYKKYVNNYYAGVLPVLRTRGDASSVMLRRLRECAELYEEEGIRKYSQGLGAVWTILTDEHYYNLLTEEEKQWFDEFKIYELYGKLME